MVVISTFLSLSVDYWFLLLTVDILFLPYIKKTKKKKKNKKKKKKKKKITKKKY